MIVGNPNWFYRDYAGVCSLTSLCGCHGTHPGSRGRVCSLMSA